MLDSARWPLDGGRDVKEQGQFEISKNSEISKIFFWENDKN